MSQGRTDGLLPFQSIPGPRRLSLLDIVATQTRLDRDPIGTMLKWRTDYGDVVRLESRFGSQVFAFAPAYNRVIHTEIDRFISRPFVLPGPPGSAQTQLRQSIFNVNGRPHRELRHQLLPPFQRSAMPGHLAEIAGLIHDVTGDWRPGQQRDLHRDMHRLVWSVVRKLLYGLPDSVASDELYHGMEDWMFDTFSPWVRSFPFNLPFTPFRRMLRKAERLREQFLAIIRNRRANDRGAGDALSALIRFRPDGAALPDEILAGHAMTLFLVAYETTGNTLTWAIFLLAQHPEVQHALLDELAPFRGDLPIFDDLDALPLLDRVLKETTRLMPAVPYSRRLTVEDGPFGPYFLPKRTRVIFSHYVTHHMPEIYPEPQAFRPERWETIRPTPAEFMPFGAGKRTCLGTALAQCVIKTALALILPAWRVGVVPHSHIDRRQGISLGPRNGLPVIVVPQDRRLEAAPITGNVHEMVDLRTLSERPIVRRAA
ncbi:MAG: cytochrome P450 [Gemmataceae bacterium]